MEELLFKYQLKSINSFIVVIGKKLMDNETSRTSSDSGDYDEEADEYCEDDEGLF